MISVGRIVAMPSSGRFIGDRRVRQRDQRRPDKVTHRIRAGANVLPCPTGGKAKYRSSLRRGDTARSKRILTDSALHGASRFDCDTRLAPPWHGR
jgi:hypothetical protein